MRWTLRIAVLVAALSLAGLVLGVRASTNGWPVTCVELNDIVEAHRGRNANVGIYQRAYGDQAEAACRNDHLADVQAAFAWALPTPAPAQASVPATSETPVAAHPDYARVVAVALARGAPVDDVATIAEHVIRRGTVDAFLEGTEREALYGEHHCQWRSAACPLSPEEPDRPSKSNSKSSTDGGSSVDEEPYDPLRQGSACFSGGRWRNPGSRWSITPTVRFPEGSCICLDGYSVCT
jgi:hypothetical protein